MAFKKTLVLSEISQPEKEEYHMISLIYGICEQNKLTNKIETDSVTENGLTAVRGERSGRAG